MGVDVIGYCRLSDKKETSSSIASQKRRIIEYCDRYSLNLLQIFVDDGKSGWTFDRPGFIQLEKFCKANRSVRMLIIPHFDRFSRADPIDAMVKERHFRDKLKVKVLQLSEPPDTDTENSTYQIIRFMQAYAANEERNRIVDRVKTSIRHRSLMGYYCNHAPYGYKNVRDDKGQSVLAIEPEHAAIVKFIFKHYLAGHSIEETRKAAAKKGFSKKGNSAIQRILATPTYAGLINVAAYKGQPSKTVKGIHEAIVTEHQYWTVQEKLSGKSFIPMKRPEVPLRGVLRCAVCGKLLTASASKGRAGKYYWYYYCKQDRKENFSAEKVHAQLAEILSAISISGDQFTALREKLFKMLQGHINSQTKELMRVDLSIRATEKVIEDIEVQQLKTPVSEGVFTRVMAEKKLYLSELLDRKEMLKATAIDYMSRLHAAMNNASNLNVLFQSMDLAAQQTFLKQVFGWKPVYTGGNFRTNFINPIFAAKAASVKGLPLVIETENPLESGSNLESGLRGSLSEPTMEFLEQFLAVFAA